MATCKDCGKKFGFLQGADGVCAECRLQAARDNAPVEKQNTTSAHEIAPSRQEPQADLAALQDILLTTETSVNLKILNRIEIVTAECAVGMNIFKDLFASVRDVVGGRSKAVENSMRDARKTALLELRKEAHLVGGNAVVGVSLTYVELGGPGSNMIMLVASGTAVEIEIP